MAIDDTLGDEPTDEAPELPRRIGRYVVIERVGAGAMGVVYAAFDPELSRKLAIKVLHASGDAETARARLAREAQALARLSHPNVVQIYDVGTFARSVYVAMEFAAGETLRSWARVARSLDAKLGVLLQVARGLAAAHRGGIVHRDVKPDNVIIGSIEGQRPSVRVVDFGLARGASDVDDDPVRSTSRVRSADAAVLEEMSVSDSLGERMTHTGTRLGTPAYMAPEQWTAKPVDARTDQFAFCILAWELLYGARPFAADNIAALGFAITHGKIASPPAGSAVPMWIARLLQRGLSTEPAARHADMDALIAALERDPAVLRRRAALGGAAVAAVGGAVWFGTTLGVAAPVVADDPCAAADLALAGVWDDGRRAAVGAALRATGRSYADDTVTRVGAVLDAWAERFVAARRDACEATHVRHEQSDDALDLRIACLDRGRSAAVALVDLLAAADVAVLDRAARSVEALPDPDECASVTELRDSAPWPEDTSKREEAAAIREVLARARALEYAGRPADAVALVEPLVARAEALGWAPVRGEVLELQGILASEGPDPAASVPMLQAAYLAAVEGRHERLAWAAALRLTSVLASVPGRSEQARESLALVRAQHAHARLGRKESALVENAAFRVEVSAGDFQAARRSIERSVELFDDGTESSDLAGALANLGVLVGMIGDGMDSVPYLERAIAIRERVQAPRHPDVARDLHNLGSMLAQERRFAEAAPLLTRALDIKREALGSRHPDIAYSLAALGNIAIAMKRLDEAETKFREALEIQEAALGPDHPDLGFSLEGLGEVLLAEERPKDALVPLGRALAVREAGQGREHPALAGVLHMIGLAELRGGAPARAVTMLDRARALRRDADPYDRAASTWALAQARAKLGERRDATALAMEAREDYVASGDLGAAEVREIDAWLAGQRASP